MIVGSNETSYFNYDLADGIDKNHSEYLLDLAIDILQLIQLYYMPVLVILGCVGNTLSVLVFFGTKLKKLSSSYYLAALAFSDTGFLVAQFITWLNLVNVPLFKKSGFCEMAIYFSHVSTSFF